MPLSRSGSGYVDPNVGCLMTHNLAAATAAAATAAAAAAAAAASIHMHTLVCQWVEAAGESGLIEILVVGC